MKTIIRILLSLFVWTSLGMGAMSGAYGDTSTADNKTASPGLNRIALMPFFLGRVGSLDSSVVGPQRQPFSLLQVNLENINDGADATMNRIIFDELLIRVPKRMVSMEVSGDTYQTITQDPSFDTLRKRAVKLGQETAVSRVVVGALWRFREKQRDTTMAITPASVAFSLYLIEIPSGKRIWEGGFEGTQKVLSKDIIGGLKQIKMGVRWLQAHELARYGVKQALRKFPE
jgi:hypothetical protein